MTSRRWKLALIIVLPKGTGFFLIIPIRASINSVRKIFGNQIVFIPSITVIPFSKHFSFHLGIALVHAKWANLIIGFIKRGSILQFSTWKLVCRLVSIYPLPIFCINSSLHIHLTFYVVCKRCSALKLTQLTTDLNKSRLLEYKDCWSGTELM